MYACMFACRHIGTHMHTHESAYTYAMDTDVQEASLTFINAQGNNSSQEQPGGDVESRLPERNA